MSLSQRSNFLRFLLSAVLVFLYAGCSRQTPNGRVLASADGNVLRMNDVASHVDTNSAYAVRNYVSHWVDEQLLYGEAEKMGLGDSRQFDQRVKEFSTQLAITMFLNKRIYDVPPNLPAKEISDFYEAHRSEFVASDDIAYVNYAAFDKRSYAVAFRNALVSGSAWQAAFGEIPAYGILEAKDSVYLRESSSTGAVWNVIQSLEAGRVSFPIQVDSLSYVVQVLSKIKPGQALPLNFASPRIRERLTIEKRQHMYKALIDSLRALGNYQVDPSVAIRDTNSQE